MKKILLGLFLLLSALSYAQTSNDVDAEAFITACDADPAGKLTYIQKVYITQLVEGLKSIGVWTKCRAIYPFVGGTAFKHKFNLKDPRDLAAAFRLSFSGSFTHSSTGCKPDLSGTTTLSQANTFINPLAQSFDINNMALSVYLGDESFNNNTAVNGGQGGLNIDIGLDNTATLNIRLGLTSRYNISNYQLLWMGNNTEGAGRVIILNDIYPKKGFFLGNRQASNLMKFYVNNTLIATNTGTTSGGSFANQNITLFNFGTRSYFSPREQRFASVMNQSLTDTEAIQLSHLIRYSQATLERQ